MNINNCEEYVERFSDMFTEDPAPDHKELVHSGGAGAASGSSQAGCLHKKYSEVERSPKRSPREAPSISIMTTNAIDKTSCLRLAKLA